MKSVIGGRAAEEIEADKRHHEIFLFLESRPPEYVNGHLHLNTIITVDGADDRLSQGINDDDDEL